MHMCRGDVNPCIQREDNDIKSAAVSLSTCSSEIQPLIEFVVHFILGEGEGSLAGQQSLEILLSS